jgi:hypothetical protein
MDRPTMSAALLMLISDLDSVVGGGTYSINEVTITNFEAR